MLKMEGLRKLPFFKSIKYFTTAANRGTRLAD